MGFIRKKEDFVCRACGERVKGTGYTNHCPNCLVSEHVDEEIPGDRASVCKGLMYPKRVEIVKERYVITHKCEKCGKETKIKASEEDNKEEIIKLIF